MPQINEVIEYPAFSSENSANATLPDSNPDPSAGIFIAERATDLLLQVSLSAESTSSPITDLAYSAMDELAKIAVVGKPLWQLQKESKYETLNDIEYLKEFGHVDATLLEIMKMVEVGEPAYLPSFDSSRVDSMSMLTKPTSIGSALQIEASRDIAYVKMNPTNVVELLMDLGQWSEAFHKIVSGAMVLRILRNGVEGSYDGKLQVMSAEFHLPTPLVATRKCNFARYCKQLCHDEWAVVDVSLEEFFTDPSANFRRRPSGCYIKEMEFGYSKVTWVEHVEADYRGLNGNFKHLVTSGFAFSATRWISCILRHCEWRATLKAATTTPTADGGKSTIYILSVELRNLIEIFHC
ncbi:hypothetical protein L6164_022464 [Bauhinia variegata]|uniref:Uncharacterized protein n=1 Tax=Bauhinia variegata TaxID=167791 RepID=A0ACB9MH18_BAUVA|nr:hypothetical protein L6164_022464 [Bauhinia variegata]